MAYLDAQQLNATDAQRFRNAEPFPWQAFPELLTPERWQELHDNLPPFEMFTAVFGRKRKGGQRSHDRYVLQHRPWTHPRLPRPWQEFIKELKSERYRGWLRQLLGHDDFLLHFHWHYTPRGCSVSPHCDAQWKLGSHIFYFNGEDDWNPAWGGETIILDDGGRYPPETAPEFDAFDRQWSGPNHGNWSLLFLREEHSWHGVKEIDCPEDAYRKVFIVEIREATPVQRLRVSVGV
jgi:hypothetical protein